MVISWTMRACFLSKQSFWCCYQRWQTQPYCKYEEERYGLIYRLKSPVMRLCFLSKQISCGDCTEKSHYPVMCGLPSSETTALLPVCQKHHCPAWPAVALPRSQYPLLPSDLSCFHSCRSGAQSAVPATSWGDLRWQICCTSGLWTWESPDLFGSTDSCK